MGLGHGISRQLVHLQLRIAWQSCKSASQVLTSSLFLPVVYILPITYLIQYLLY